MGQRLFHYSFLTTLVVAVLHCALLLAQSTVSEDALNLRAADRIRRPIDDTERVALPGNHPHLVRPAVPIGIVSPQTRLERMILVLAPSPEQNQALTLLLEAQQDPSSSAFHHWLTPEEFGLRFGVSNADLEQITAWLGQQGFTIDSIASGRNSLIFSGTATQVKATFHTVVSRYLVYGQRHLANANDPDIPAALAGIVEGVVSLHDFRSRPLHTAAAIFPQYTNAGGHYLSPADFATIYDLGPLYLQYNDGTGQSIAVAGRSNLHLSDVRAFRSTFGLPAKDPVIVLNGRDPGTAVNDDFNEATLDVEWAGAVARNAGIQLVASASSNVTDGIYLSAQYIVDHNLAPVLSMSYGLCESSLGNAENTFLNNLWQQAAAQGITVVVASGDSGAAGCDAASATFAIAGRAVNGFCSTPYNTCVGGTQFDDANATSLYWSALNDASGRSARSYIPERAWNESGPSGLWSSGGGASSVYLKPVWQASAGVPADGRRDVPDISLAAAGHTAYLVYVNGNKYGFSGTSAATPAFAGVMAIVNQSSNARQGNPNPVLYRLAAQEQSGSGPAIFHDLVSGNNSVPGLAGFQASPGYDQATGLGSVDGFALVTHWNESKLIPALAFSLSAPSVNLIAGSTAGLTVTISVSGGFNAPVNFSISGLPAGVSASFAPAGMPAPGAGTTVLHFTSSPLATPGTYSAVLTASSSSGTKNVTLPITVLPVPDFRLGVSDSPIAVEGGGQTSSRVVLTGNSTFSAAVQFAVTGLPPGMSASFSPAVLAAPGTGSSTLSLSASSRVASGVYTLIVTATGAGISHSSGLNVQVSSYSLTLSTNSITLSPGGFGSLAFTIGGQTRLHTPVLLTVAGLPPGITYSLRPASLLVSKGSTGSLIFVASSTAALGSRDISLTGYADGVSKSVTLSLNVTEAPAFDEANAATILVRGSTTGVPVSTMDLPPFDSAVSLSLSGLPVGVAGSFSPSSLAAPGLGLSRLTLSASRLAVPGTYACTFTVTGVNTAKTMQVTLTIQ